MRRGRSPRLDIVSVRASRVDRHRMQNTHGICDVRAIRSAAVTQRRIRRLSPYPLQRVGTQLAPRPDSREMSTCGREGEVVAKIPVRVAHDGFEAGADDDIFEI